MSKNRGVAGHCWTWQASTTGPTAVGTVAAQQSIEQGFGTELWTLKRVRFLIERIFGVTCSEVHVWRILGALGLSSQKPERCAIECNEDAVQEQDLPALKKSPQTGKSDHVH